METFFLRLHGYGTGSAGTRVKATLYYPNDPGYVDTSRMLVESGLAMALEQEVIEKSGGCYSSAACFQGTILQRLIDTGCTFKISEC